MSWASWCGRRPCLPAHPTPGVLECLTETGVSFGVNTRRLRWTELCTCVCVAAPMHAASQTCAPFDVLPVSMTEHISD